MSEILLDANLLNVQKLDSSPFNEELDNGDAIRFCLFDDGDVPSLRIKMVMFDEDECTVSIGYIDGVDAIQDLIQYLSHRLNSVRTK